MLGRRLALLVGVLLCVASAGLVLGGASALALEEYPFSGSFGGAGAGDGQFAEPSGVAVSSSTHDVYVVDRGNDRVEIFSSTGVYVGQFDGSAAPSGVFSSPSEIAVDNSGSALDSSAGDVYVVDTGHNVIDKFTASGTYLGQITETTGGAGFEELRGVAVDANGVVWVDQASGEIDSFSDGLSNEYLSKRISAWAFQGTHPGFAVDSEDNLYVNRGLEVFSKLNTAGERLIGELGAGEASVGAAVNLSNNEVLISTTRYGVFAYSSAGSPTVTFGAEHLQDGHGIAVDPSNGTVFVADGTANVVDIFRLVVAPDVTTGAASGVQPTSATLNGTVNPDGLQLNDCHFEYSSSTSAAQSAPCVPAAGSIPADSNVHAVSAEVTGLTAGTVYNFRLLAGNAEASNSGQEYVFGPPAIGEQSSASITQTAATLQAQVNPDAVDTTCRFEYVDAAHYDAAATDPYSAGGSVPCTPADLGAGESAQPASAEIGGLQVGVTYHWRVVAVNAAGSVSGEDQVLTTVAPASIDSVTITNVSSTGAVLHAQIDPLGTDTTYQFQYGTDTSYGLGSIPVPDADIGSGSVDVPVSQQISGLQPDVTYHVRVVAHNALGTETSGDHTFVYDTSGEELPDNRAYEMVTPPQKNAALLGAVFGGNSVVAADGSRLILDSLQCFAGAGSCTALRDTTGEPFAFTRTGAGWVTTAMAPPASRFEYNTWDLFNADTGDALFSIATSPLGEDDYYVRQPDGSFVDIGPVTQLSRGASGPGGVNSVMGTADFSHVVYEVVNGFWSFDATDSSGNVASVYEYAGEDNSQPVLVGVSGGPGSTDLISVCSTYMGTPSGEGYNALSADGGTVFFTAQRCASGSGVNAGVPVPADELFARIGGSRTVLVSGRSALDCTSAACVGSPASDALFEGASADGSKVFFTDTQQLTDSASEDSGDTALKSGSGCAHTTGTDGCNLYEYDFSAPAGHNLMAVSAGDRGGGGPRVQGVVAISGDGSHVYFVAKGVLTGAANGQGEVAHGGADNLYVFERDASYPQGRVAFVAGLSGENSGVNADSQQWSGLIRRANVTPDGRFLVFQSKERLTADDTSTTGVAQVFRYDALTETLVRISIGEHGFNDNGNAGMRDATIVPAGHGQLQIGGPARSDPTMSDDGSFVFFQSPVGLTPGALDDVQIGKDPNGKPIYAGNVYEWHEGHVYLISDGRDTAQYFGGVFDETEDGGGFTAVDLVGSDTTGRNVFFTTADSLVPQDTDTGVDYYDARICSAGDPCVANPPQPAPPCVGEACHGTPGVAPVFGAPGSAVFSGAGNTATQSGPAVKAKKKTKPKKGGKVKHKKRKGARRPASTSTRVKRGRK